MDQNIPISMLRANITAAVEGKKVELVIQGKHSKAIEVVQPESADYNDILFSTITCIATLLEMGEEMEKYEDENDMTVCVSII